MRITEIKYPDVANGEGIRLSLFLQGCSKHCKGCFNPETWDYNGGRLFSFNDKEYIFDKLSLYYVKGLSVLGGEPLDQTEELQQLLEEIKNKFPKKDIWLWTGNKFEDIMDLPIIQYVDYIVDGEFIEDRKNLSLKFRGSDNQRIIKVKEMIEMKGVMQLIRE